MKKKNVGKAVVLPLLAAAAFASVGVGTTFALFTSKAEATVTVTSGKIELAKTVTAKAYSKDVERTDGTFENGGAYSVTDGVVTLTNLTPGDKVVVNLAAENNSNVAIKTRLSAKATGEVASGLRIAVKGAKMIKAEDGLYSAWSEVIAAGGEVTGAEVSIELPYEAGDEWQGKGGSVALTLEAVQGNADVEDPEGVAVVTDETGVKDAIAAAKDGEAAKIALSGDLTLTEDLALGNKKIVVDSIGHSTIDLGGKTVSNTMKESLFVVDSGDVTFKNGTISTSAEYSAAIAANNDAHVTIESGTYTAAKSNCVVSYNGATLDIKGGTFESSEYTVQAKGNSNITIEGGTFTAKDNAAIATLGGEAGNGGNTITVNGGTFNCGIKSNGFIACGVFVCNSDTVNLNGGTFIVDGGVGVLARGGTTTIGKDVVLDVSKNTNNLVSGKVGSGKFEHMIPVGHEIVTDKEASYPDYENIKINNNTSYDVFEFTAA